jgi:hypothetical protein
MALEWREGIRSARHGYAGRVRLFTVDWGLVRKDDKPWVLRCTLPGYESRAWNCTDQDEAAAKAERLWAAWLSAAGVTTSEETT